MLKVVTTSMVIAVIALANGCCTPYVGEREVPGYGGVYSACHCGDCDDCCDGRPTPYSMRDGFRNMRRSLVCGGGCGEIYYGEWRNYPPDCPDPCDDCGNFTGSSCNKCLPRTRIWNLLARIKGQRWCDPCADCCESYDDGYETYDSEIYDGEIFDGEIIDTGEVIHAAPTKPACNCGAAHTPRNEGVRRLRTASQRNVDLSDRKSPTPATKMSPGQRFALQTSHEAPIIR